VLFALVGYSHGDEGRREALVDSFAIE